QRHDVRRDVLAAHDEHDRGLRFGEMAIDVSHRYRSADGRAEAAGRDLAYRRAVRRAHLAALARRDAALRFEADPPPRRAVAQFGKHARGARKAAGFPPPLLDRPGKPRLDRRGRGVDVVAIETKPGLE